MTDKPILFSAPMVRALLDGRKTQTRRFLTQPSEMSAPSGCKTVAEYCTGSPEKGLAYYWRGAGGGWNSSDPIPIKYRVGDRLWVRETWRPSLSSSDPWHVAVLYDADKAVKHWGWSSDADFGDWIMPKQASKGNVPSIHMPRWASRLTLTVTDVRVQRLQEISLGDICAEGLARTVYDFKPATMGFSAFKDLWNSINGADAWEQNPWVAAYTFTVDRKNIDQTNPKEPT